MKLNKKKLLKSLLIFLVSIFSILGISLLVLHNDASRNFIINQVVKFVQSGDFSLKIKGANKELTHVDQINIKGLSYSIDIFHLNVKRDRTVIYPRLKAETVVFKSLNTEKKSSANFDLKKISDVLRKTRLFVKTLKVSKVILKIDNEEHLCEDVAYQSEKNQDVISARIKQSKSNIIVDWTNSGQLRGDFENIFGYSVNFQIGSLRKSEPTYKIMVKNSNQELIAQGSILDKMKTIAISKASFKHKDIKLDFSGKALLNSNQLNLSTKLSLDNFIDTRRVPSEVVKNFSNISANLLIEKKGEEFDAKISFERNNRKIGHSRIKFKDKFLSAQFDVSWIDLWGYKINNLNVQSNDLKDFAINIDGDDFKCTSEIVYDKDIIIKDLICDVEKGKVVSKKAFSLNDFNSLFEFNFESLDFFKKLCKLNGNVTGKLSFPNKKFRIDAKVSKLYCKDYELYNGRVSGSLDDLKIDVDDVRCFRNTLKSLTFTKKNKGLSLKAKLNNKSDVILQGSYADNVLHAVGNIKNKNNLLELKDGSANFNKKQYNISFEVTDKSKIGKFQLSVSPDKINSTIENLSVRGIGQIFNKTLPQCFVNGGFSLTPQQNLFFGNGHLKLDGIISKKSTFDINLKQDQKGLYIQGDLANATDHLQFNTLIPIFVDRNLNYSIKKDFPIEIFAKGGVHIENFFEFPDGVNVRGKIDSDFSVGGSLVSPEINGTLEYTKASIVVSDVVLRNGTIKLKGCKNKFLVDNASFTDSYGKKVEILGGVNLSFSDDIFSINSDLTLNFDNFCLFNTDTTKIHVLGTGKMTGPIDDMKLSGDLKVPLCELTFSETENTSDYEDIVFVNDKFLRKKKEKKNDFFLYDVGLACSRIKIVGDIYKLEFGGNLHLGSYKKEATLSGSMKLKEGKLNLFGKRMIFEKTEVEFTENHPFDPKLSLVCSKNLDNIKVFLRITNTPERGMSIDLYSKPHYTQDVILSQMMFGKSSRNLSVGEAAQLAHALNSLKQKGYIFSILNTFQNIGLVDSISFSTENDSSSLYKNSQTSSNNQINVKAGKYLSDDIYISVNQKEKETSFDVDLSIGSNASLKVNTQGEVGVSWKFRY